MCIFQYNFISNKLHIKLDAGHFVVSKFGSLCRENRRHSLASKDECFRAFETFPKKGKDSYVSFVINKTADWPKLCFGHAHIVFWNPHPTGKKNTAAGEICYSYRTYVLLRHIFGNCNIFRIQTYVYMYVYSIYVYF